MYAHIPVIAVLMVSLASPGETLLTAIHNGNHSVEPSTAALVQSCNKTLKGTWQACTKEAIEQANKGTTSSKLQKLNGKKSTCMKAFLQTCFNNAACEKCTFREAQAVGKYYDKNLDIYKTAGCKVPPKCQNTFLSSANVSYNKSAGTLTTIKRNSVGLIVILVLIVLVLVVGGLIVYFLFSPFADEKEKEKVLEPKTGKGPPAHPPKSKGAPKSKTSPNGKPPPKSKKTKGKMTAKKKERSLSKSVSKSQAGRSSLSNGKSTIKSSVSNGLKVKAKSSMSAAKSSVSGTKSSGAKQHANSTSPSKVSSKAASSSAVTKAARRGK